MLKTSSKPIHLGLLAVAIASAQTGREPSVSDSETGDPPGAQQQPSNEIVAGADDTLQGKRKRLWALGCSSIEWV